MILDMHAHSIKSDDGRAKVENYCQWIKAKDIAIDGFVLTEHRQYDDESDYSDLAEANGITIFKGSEVETEYGHVLVFGVTPALQEEFDFSNINLNSNTSLKQAINTMQSLFPAIQVDREWEWQRI